jgi:hypothetical protein
MPERELHVLRFTETLPSKRRRRRRWGGDKAGGHQQGGDGNPTGNPINPTDPNYKIKKRDHAGKPKGDQKFS